MGLYKRKDSPYWWVCYRIKGRLVRTSLGTDVKRLAETRAAERLIDLEKRKARGTGPDESGRTIGELVARYLAECTPKKRHTLRDFTIAEHIKFFFGGELKLDEIAEVIHLYEPHRTKARAGAATIVKELGLLRRMFSVAIKRWRWVRFNPVSLVEMPKVDDARVRFLNPEEVTRLMVALPLWIRPIVEIARNTGLRRGNLLNLTWEQVDFKGRVLSLPQTKNGQPLCVPLNGTALKALEGLGKVRRLGSPWVFADGRGGKLSLAQVSVAFKRATMKAGVNNLRFHDLRHDFASKLVQGGVDIYRVKELLGHKDLRMTARYAHLAPENLRAAVCVLDASVHDLLTREKNEGATATP